MPVVSNRGGSNTRDSSVGLNERSVNVTISPDSGFLDKEEDASIMEATSEEDAGISGVTAHSPLPSSALARKSEEDACREPTLARRLPYLAKLDLVPLMALVDHAFAARKGLQRKKAVT